MLAQPTDSPDSTILACDALPDLCPYLATVDGSWRSSSPVREHRCIAVTPPVPLAFEKQRRLCLVADHRSCATYGAALAARPEFAARTDSGLRAVARTTPVVLDRGRFDLSLPALRADRLSTQGLLVGVLGLAFAAILVARLGGDGHPVNGAGGNAPSASPGSSVAAAASSEPSASPRPSSAPVVTARPIATAAPTPSLQATNAPATPPPAASGATYRVKSGDTLIRIAARSGTTTRVLMILNNTAAAICGHRCCFFPYTNSTNPMPLGISESL